MKKINSKFKILNITRDQLPLVLKSHFFKDRNNLKVLEIGVEFGGYLDVYYPILEEVVDKFYLVDMWETEGNDDHFRKFPGKVESGYERVRSLYGNNPKVVLNKGMSVEKSKEYHDEFFDYIYIDADHSKNAVLNDLRAWFPKLKKNGVIAGHDLYADPNNIDYKSFDVEGAVEEFFEGHHDKIFMTCEYAYNTWIYQKT